MSAIKISARVIAAVLAGVGFVASCGQLLGDYQVELASLQTSADSGVDGPLPVICTLGATQCDGRVLQLCTEEGTAWATLEPCATPELCRSSDNMTVSSCIQPACADEQMSCDGNVLRLCNPSRTGWEVFGICESAAHCDAGRRQCLPAPCEPGDRRCNVGNLERCNDDQTGWELLDACITNELCEVTLAPAATVAEVLSATDVSLQPPASDAEGPTECRTPVCVPREVTCDGNRLNACSEGQTEFALAEECATPRLCEASITYTGLRGSPRCVRPACAPGEHRCTDAGVLEVCNGARDGFETVEACIGPQFCNAVAADNGGRGCEEAPCEAGDEQCNGPQIQRCLPDRTGFEAVGAACETRGLCNDDGLTAFCAVAACQRGPLSSTEFRCEGATLLRCNDQHTGYEPISTCATAGLCNASFGFNGCQPPVCAPNETRCNGNFVQRCNANRTGFENIEQCAPGTCDSQAGRCADPCILGSARCNAQGNLEECRNLLVGREITARCGSVQLCDATARTCRTPPPGCTADGVRRCRAQGQSTVLEQCSDGRSRFVTLDTCDAGEVCDANDLSCDACLQGSEPTCEGNSLVTCSANGKTETVVPCPNGCQSVANGPDRCRTCVPGTVSCQGALLTVCRTRGNEEFLDPEPCGSAQLCQNTLAACNASGAGEDCRCQPEACDPGDRDCNGAQPVVCNADRTALVASGPSCGSPANCNPRPVGACFACAAGDVRCGPDGVMEGCRPDRSGFEDLPVGPGAVRCIDDNRGSRAQSCDGARLVDERCGEGLACVRGIGCEECNPDDFDSECATTPDGRPAVTVCEGGELGIVPCGGGDGCSEAVCRGGACQEATVEPGTPCTRNGGAPGRCDGSACVECFFAEDCDDGNACTDDICGVNGACRNDPIRCQDNGNACDGPEVCNPATGACAPSRAGCGADEICQAGVCVPSGCSGAADCNDGNACTDDVCLANGECQNSPIQCRDNGNACDGPELCNPATGACAPSLPGCAPDEVCRNGVCEDPGCTSNQQCSDGNACNGVETCVLATGVCAPGQPPACNDGNVCNGTESCDPNLGCVPGTALNCDDGDPCTVDGCGATGCTREPLCQASQTCNAQGQCEAPAPPPPPPPPDDTGNPPGGGNGNPGGPGGGNGNPGNGNGNPGGGGDDPGDGDSDTPPAASVCGNGVCEEDESIASCLIDCLIDILPG